MRTILIYPASGLLLALLLSTGCDDMTARNSPDNSPETQRAVNDVNTDALVKKHDVDVAYQDQETSISFQKKLIRDNAAEQDAEADLARDKVIQPLRVKIARISEQAKEDKNAVDLDIAQRLKNPGDQEAAIKADRTSRCAEIDRKATESIAAVTADIDQATLKSQQQHAAIAQEKEKKLTDKQLELESDERVARQKKADIDKATIEKLNSIGQKSSTATAQSRKDDQHTRDNDMKITQTIRDDVSNNQTLAASRRSVDITTTNGVVVVSGTVASDSDRQSIIAIAKKVDGVVRVDSLLAVK